MCGIFGYIGKRKKLATLISGLKSLEYRGYDSAGIAFFTYLQDSSLDELNPKPEIVIRKSQGKVEELEKIVDLDREFSVGIAHTRWATHGKPSAQNAHPHISYAGNFCIVHNGIIENFEELKATYLSDITLKSATDSEVIAHLLEKNYCGDVLKTLQKVAGLLKGSFALAAMSTHEPNKLFLAKRSSPLLFGISNDGLYFSSDVNTLGLFCSHFIKLEDEDFATLDFQTHAITHNQKPQSRPLQKFWEENKKKQNVSCYMEQEIAESPQSLVNTARDFKNQFQNIPNNFFDGLSQIILVACGTAYHSCLVGKRFLEEYFEIPILTEIASEFVYSNPRLSDKTLLIAVSQSGETADTLLALRKAKEHHAKTLAITNNPTSTITFEADFSLLMRAGWEKAVASTKAYVCQIAVFYLLASALKGELDYAESEFVALAETLENFNFKSWANKISEELPKFEKVIFIGRGLSYVTALEASLKLKEITYINSIAVASGELKHGTLALVDEKTLVVAIFCEEALREKNASTLEEITARGGNVLVLSPFCKKKKDGLLCKYKGLKPLKLPTFNEKLYTIISILPLQKLACRISQNFGYNPDMPKNLSKSVTVE